MPIQRILIVFLLFISFQAFGQQKYLVLDRYTTKRIKLSEGDPIWFQLKGDEFRIHDYIKTLTDSSLVLANRNQEIQLSEIAQFFFYRKFWQSLAPRLSFVGVGFLASAAVHPLMSNPMYNPSEAAVIGGTAIALAQASRLFRVRRYRVTPNTRVRILDLSFQRLATE